MNYYDYILFYRRGKFMTVIENIIIFMGTNFLIIFGPLTLLILFLGFKEKIIDFFYTMKRRNRK